MRRSTPSVAALAASVLFFELGSAAAHRGFTSLALTVPSLPTTTRMLPGLSAGASTLMAVTGEDPSRYNPAGYHAHSTPLHQEEVVRLLADRGARSDIRDTVYFATPLDWPSKASVTPSPFL